MPRPTQEAVAEREWRKATDAHAAQVLRNAIQWLGIATPTATPTIRNAVDEGGHVVEICGPDGEWRRYFVRLTEVPE